MKKNLLSCFLSFIFAATSIQAQVVQSNLDAQQKLAKVNKQYFIENKGQWPKEVLYLTQSAGLNTWITTKGMWYEFFKTEEINPAEKQMTNEFAMPDKFEHKETKRWGHRVGYTLIGNNKTVITEAKQKQEGYYNYLIGNDPSKHASYVGLYKEALIKEVYKGIDMRYYFDKGSLRYDYVVKPGADPRQIQFKFEGAENSYLNEKGELVFTTCFGEVKNADLYTYQEENKMQVKSKFIKTDEGFSFDLGNYNKSQTLIIDPLIYSTYIGGSGYEVGLSIALDVSANAYITGQTSSINFDTSSGAFQTINSGNNDIFVSKLNASGTALIYSTYIGGSNNDLSNSIAVDALNNGYITGNTTSNNFNITPGSFQTTLAGNNDIFVSKLNSTGSALIYSTFIGGSSDEAAYSIALDIQGNVFFTGATNSTDYDISLGAFQPTKEGTSDVFVSKLNATGNALIYSTYIGGSSGDSRGQAVAIDGLGNAYITGYTNSNNYDITPGAFQANITGGWDVFVSKLNATGTILVYSTYLGGSNSDWGNSIAVDNLGNAYITGITYSSNFDIIPGAFQANFAGNSDIFVSKFNANGTSLIYSTYIGGSSYEDSKVITLDPLNNAYVSGFTLSANYDITQGAFQTIYAGGEDIFVSKLNATGTALVYSTFVGNAGWDRCFSIALDASNNLYITGFTYSTNYYITPGAFQTVNGGNTDVFVTKLGIPFSLPIELISFEGFVIQNENEITWKTAAELNFSHYVLESSEDGINFKIVDTIVSLGNSNEINCYSYQDKKYYSPTTYYRLKSVDIDGSFNHSKIITVKRDENSTGVVVYPNPSNGIYQIDFRNGSNNYIQIEVLDMQGNLIEKQKHTNKNNANIDLSKYANGVYILKVISNNKQEIVRLVKL